MNRSAGFAGLRVALRAFALPAALLAAVFLVAVLATVPAHAEAALQWYQHYERGLERAAAGDWSGALEDFRAAQQIEPRPRNRVRTYGNRFVFAYDPAYHEARALAELGRLDAAEARLAVAEEAGVTPEADLAALRRRIAERRTAVAPAEPLGTLRVDSQPEGAQVRLDGHLLGVTPLPPVEVAAGGHRVVLSASGRGEWAQVVEVSSDETTHLQVVLPAPPVEGSAKGKGEGAGPPVGEQPTGEGAAGGGDVNTSARGGTGEAGRPAGAGSASGGAAGARETLPAGAAMAGGDRSVGEGIDAGRSGAGGGSEGAVPRPGVISPAGAAVSASAPGSAAPTASAENGGTSTGNPMPSPSSSRSQRPAEGAPSVADASSRGAGAPAGTGATGPGSAAPTAPLLPSGALAGAVVALIVLAVLAAAWLRRSRRVHPGERRAAWRLRGSADRRVGGYQVDDELGRGGMATTYRARRLSDGRTVAIKIPHETGDPTYLERFVREGRLGETLHHPGIVRIYEAGEDRGLAFLAMELLPGNTLEAEIAGHPEGMPLRGALEIARDVAEALDYAHGKGIVHRDLKPANVMLLPDGTRKVMDFGVARIEGQPGLTTSQVFFGSPVYAAPELVEPKSIGPRSDLYSLGIVLFEMLQGRPPFVHESVFRLLELHRGEPLPAGADLARPLPDEVWTLVTRLCAKSPDDRYPDAQALLVDLDRLLYAVGDEPAPAAGRTA